MTDDYELTDDYEQLYNKYEKLYTDLLYDYDELRFKIIYLEDLVKDLEAELVSLTNQCNLC